MAAYLLELICILCCGPPSTIRHRGSVIDLQDARAFSFLGGEAKRGDARRGRALCNSGNQTKVSRCQHFYIENFSLLAPHVFV